MSNHWDYLDQFLTLSNADEIQDEINNSLALIECLTQCYDEDSTKMIRSIVTASESNGDSNRKPIVFAFAYFVTQGGHRAKEAMQLYTKEICKGGMNLFVFLNYCKSFKAQVDVALQGNLTDIHLIDKSLPDELVSLNPSIDLN